MKAIKGWISAKDGNDSFGSLEELAEAGDRRNGTLVMMTRMCPTALTSSCASY